MRLILASTSPRRRQILELLGLPFEVIAPKFDEVALPHRPPEAEALELAWGKACSVAAANPASIVIGSDTMILSDGEKIGKPEGAADARRILRSLSGRTHRILTGVAVVDGLGGPGLGIVEEVAVKMREYSDAEIERYLAHGESLDKAGAYSIQGRGRALIESIRGDYLAAVGMPLRPIADYLKRRGIAVPADVEKIYAEKSFLNWRSFQEEGAVAGTKDSSYVDQKGRHRWRLNDEIGERLKELGDFLIIGGYEESHAKRYGMLAHTVSRYPVSVAELHRQGRLKEIPGVGGTIAEIIGEILNTGTCRKMEEWAERVPKSVLELTAIPGLGAKTARMLYAEHGIDSLKGLERALDRGDLAGVKGLGKKMLERMRQHAKEKG